jgi:hypothetical protein
MPGDVHYQFLSYSRRGLAAAIARPDTLGKPGQPPIPALASFDVTLPVVPSPGATDPAPVRRTVAVSGPGDITGLAPAAVVRTWPANGQTNAETTFFPLVEFDHPDLPWLFTPAAPTPPDPADGGGRLRPWLVLIVVEQRSAPDDAALQRGNPLPQLVVPQAAAWQLPDLAESWLWAHAQVTPLDGETVEAALTGDPRRNLSRLLCPRRLRPQTHYLACVVPAFDVGRKAGLGAPVLPADEQALAPAFQPGVTTTLPVYYQWTFATGGAGDFETLARKLTGRVVPDGVGHRALDISHPGPGLPVVDGVTGIGDTRAVLALDGALRRPKAAPGQWAEPQRSAFVSRLTEILDTPARLAAAGSGTAAGPHTVAPPIYGQFHAAHATLGSGSPPPWLRELNTDPGRRVAAARGTEVIQDHQEEMVARAWEQVGDILDANRALRLAQLARAAGTSVHARYLAPLGPADLVGVTAAVHTRLRGVAGPADRTAAANIRASRLPHALTTTAFRRLARPRGPVARRAAEPSAVQLAVAGVAGSTLRDTVPDRPPDGTVQLSSPSAVLGAELAGMVLAALGDAPPAGTDPGSRLDQFAGIVNAAAAPVTTRDLVVRQPAQGVTAALTLFGVGVRRAAGGAAGGAGLGHGGGGGVATGGVATGGVGTGGVTSGGLTTGGVAAGGVAAGGAAAGGQAGGGAVTAVSHGGLIGATIGGGQLARADADRPDPADAPPGPTDAALLADLLAGIRASADRDVTTANAPDPPERPTLDLAPVRTGLLAALDPELTIPALITARLTVAADLHRAVVPADPLQPVMASPVFRDPMYEPLRDLSEQWLLPGLENVLLDTATLVETNPSFVAAYLVGLNHEFARELLWREYPTDQRGTYFARFWGRPGADDIGPIHGFHGALAGNVLGGGTPQLVLLVRGELLHRYPGAIIYAAQARLGTAGLELDNSTILPPAFRGTLLPDTTFIGFPLTVDDVTGANAPDWWFVIAEHPTEPRFGLDEDVSKDLAAADWTWNDLAWPNLVPAAGSVNDLVHAPAAAPPLAGKIVDGVRWGSDAAGQAHATFQQPVRVAIRAKPLIEAAKVP